MCGIAGVIQYESEVSRELRHKALRILFSELMLKTETRGKDATGLYQVMANGDWLMTKKAQKVTDWLFQSREDSKCEDPYVYTDIMGSWIEHPEELSTVIGHCRAKTVGSTTNENNHPFAIQLDEKHALLGVHNGTLYNHELVFDRLPEILKRQGTVDSECIFHFLYYMTESGTEPITPEVIRHVGNRLDGGFACVVSNSRFPHQVAVFRDGRPMEFVMIAPLNIVVLASEKRFIQSALEKYDFIRRLVDTSLPELYHEDRMLPDRDFRIFDTTKKFPSGKFSWNSFDAISESGEIRKFHENILEDWKDPKTSSVSSKSTYSRGGTGTPNYSKPATGTSGAKTTKATGSAISTVRTLPATTKSSKAGDKEDSGVLVEVEIGTEAEANKGYEKIKSLGVCVHYDTEKEIATALGRDEEDIAKMSSIEMANLLTQMHFNLGYASSRIDSKKETNDIRSKGRELLLKLEKAEEKKKRSQNHVWEHKAVIQSLLSLYDGGYKLDLSNVELVVKAFPELNEERRKDVLKTAKEVLESSSTRKVIEELRKSFKDAESKKQQSRQNQYRVE